MEQGYGLRRGTGFVHLDFVKQSAEVVLKNIVAGSVHLPATTHVLLREMAKHLVPVLLTTIKKLNTK